MKFAIAQLNPCVGDVVFNTQLAIDATAEARALSADLIVFPECMLTGYPPEDILFRSGLPDLLAEAHEKIAAASEGLQVLIGSPQYTDPNTSGLVRGDQKIDINQPPTSLNPCYNAAYHYHDGRLQGIYSKQSLPNRAVFDEYRYFIAGDSPYVFTCAGKRIGVIVCEDGWNLAIADQYAGLSLDAVVQLNASPYRQAKQSRRYEVAGHFAARAGASVICVNCVGGQDELVFDGASFAVLSSGEVACQTPQFEAGVYLGSVDAGTIQADRAALLDADAELYQALIWGLRDYIHKCGASRVILGLSGGIDSALTLAIAVDALGAEFVEAVSMPSCYTAEVSIEDARQMCMNLGVAFSVLPISEPMGAFERVLADRFAGVSPDETEENLQARIRGVLLMALSNKFGPLVLSCGNKSEIAVGYSTLYGDMVGAFCVLKDVYKTQVYALARYRNGLGVVIPQRIIDRPPSAELRPDQCDQDSLPDYDVLDAVLALAVESGLDAAAIIARGFDEGVVHRVLGLLKRAEYKRAQGAPGVRVTRKGFGKDWRMPIASRYRF